MTLEKSNILTQVIAGIFGGTILGIATFIIMMQYGANHGCWPFLDSIFHTAGYESCGSFGASSGVLIGSIAGVFMVKKNKFTNPLRTAKWLLLGTFMIPFIFGLIIFWPPFQDGEIFIAINVIFVFALFSTIPASLLTVLKNWREIFKF